MAACRRRSRRRHPERQGQRTGDHRFGMGRSFSCQREDRSGNTLPNQSRSYRQGDPQSDEPRALDRLAFGESGQSAALLPSARAGRKAVAAALREAARCGSSYQRRTRSGCGLLCKEDRSWVRCDYRKKVARSKLGAPCVPRPSGIDMSVRGEEFDSQRLTPRSKSPRLYYRGHALGTSDTTASHCYRGWFGRWPRTASPRLA